MTETFIHPTALVDQNAEIGVGSHIGPYCVVGPRVKIGDRVTLKSHVVVEGDTAIGEESVIHPFASLGVTPQDLKYKGEESLLRIGKRNQIREYANISKGTEPGGNVTQLGDDNLIMVYTHIAHDCIMGNKCIVANGVSIAGHAVIDDEAVIGGLSGIHQFVTIGSKSMIAAGSKVSQDVPPFCMVHGDHARIKGLNLVGLRRMILSSEEMADIKAAYKILYKDQLVQDLAVERLQQSLNADWIKEKFDVFFKKSQRGICR